MRNEIRNYSREIVEFSALFVVFNIGFYTAGGFTDTQATAIELLKASSGPIALLALVVSLRSNKAARETEANQATERQQNEWKEADIRQQNEWNEADIRQQNEWSNREEERKKSEIDFQKKMIGAFQNELLTCLNSGISAIKVFDTVTENEEINLERLVVSRLSMPTMIRENMKVIAYKLDAQTLNGISAYDGMYASSLANLACITGAEKEIDIKRAILDFIFCTACYLREISEGHNSGSITPYIQAVCIQPTLPPTLHTYLTNSIIPQN